MDFWINLTFSNEVNKKIRNANIECSSVGLTLGLFHDVTCSSPFRVIGGFTQPLTSDLETYSYKYIYIYIYAS